MSTPENQLALTEFAQKAEKIARALDTLNYFQLLRVDQAATSQDIRAAYHRQSRLFHPDRYHHLGMKELAANLTAISKRMAEAYVVLRHPGKRKHYQEAIARQGGPRSLRFVAADAHAIRDEESATLGSTAKVRQMVGEATVKWQRGQKQEAIAALKMALIYESTNGKLRDLLQQWEGA